jgi:hypothetical protein
MTKNKIPSGIADPMLAHVLASSEPIPILCPDTGLQLGELDDGTTAYLLELDVSGSILARIATQRRHPALCAMRNDWSLLADTCPVVYLCALLMRFVHFPSVPRESFAWAVAQHDIAMDIEAMYEDGTISDSDIVSITEALALTCITDSPLLGARPAVAMQAHKEGEAFGISRKDIDELCSACIAGINGLPRASVWRTIASYWTDTHRYIPTVQALWGIKETPSETLRRIVKKRTDVTISERELAKLDFLDAMRIGAMPSSASLSKALALAPAKPAQCATQGNLDAASSVQALDAFAALAALLKNA